MASLINICEFDVTCGALSRHRFVWSDGLIYYACDDHIADALVSAAFFDSTGDPLGYEVIELWPV